MKHLEAWHARHTKSLKPLHSALGNHKDSGLNSDPDKIASSDSDSPGDTKSPNTSPDSDLSEFLKLCSTTEPAEWMRLLHYSNTSRRRQAAETRNRNQVTTRLAEMLDHGNLMGKKRGPGRPPKVTVAEKLKPDNSPTAKKRGPGGPLEATIAKKPKPDPSPKRGPGRPPKAKIVKTEATKRGRGRPPRAKGRAD